MSKHKFEKEDVFGETVITTSNGKKFREKDVFGETTYIDEDGNTYREKDVFGETTYVGSNGTTIRKKDNFGEDTYIGDDGEEYTERSSKCFISTASVNAVGLPDNATELMILRSFRENYLLGTVSGDKILSEYEGLSKEILTWIDDQPEQQKISLYKDLYERLVLKSVSLIRHNKNAEAISHYKNIVREYKKMITDTNL